MLWNITKASRASTGSGPADSASAAPHILIGSAGNRNRSPDRGWRGLYVLLVLSLPLASCVLSRGPFYMPEVEITPPKLEGKWRILDKDGQPEKTEYWEFKEYLATASDEEGRSCSLQVVYFQAGGLIFADTAPSKNGCSASHSGSGQTYYQMHEIPLHMVSRIEVTGDRLTVRPLNKNRFNQVTRGKPVGHWVVQEEYQTLVLYASPADWVTFLGDNGHDDALFPESDQIVFERESE